MPLYMFVNSGFLGVIPGIAEYHAPRLIIATILAITLAMHGYKKGSLSKNGAVAAFFVGFSSFGTSARFGFILILFYYTSSKLTKVKEDVKAKLEDNYVTGGKRGAVQVFACSLLGTVVCILFACYIGEDRHISFGINSSDSNVDLTFFTYSKSRAAAQFWSMYIAHYSCATADTWASELGILATRKPRLVTTLFLREVPHGTNGGVSLLGTGASIAGGAFIGIIFWAMSPTGSDPSVERHTQYPMILVGLLCGFLGSMIDSILGATVQATYYSKDKKCIIKDPKLFRHQHEKCDIEHICGINALSNESVNFLSIFLTMLVSLWLSPAVFCACDSRHCI